MLERVGHVDYWADDVSPAGERISSTQDCHNCPRALMEQVRAKVSAAENTAAPSDHFSLFWIDLDEEM
jgi:hypothetical protein